MKNRSADGFHAKGLVFQGALDFYAGYVPGGLDALAEALEPELRAFLFDERFLASSWYDIFPIVPISATAARVAGVPHRTLVRENAAWVANRDMNGVHRFILSVASPARVVTRLPRLSMQYFDFGDTDGELVDDQRFETSRVHIPEPLADWMVWVIEGFTPVVLEAAGAEKVVVTEVLRETLGRFGKIPTLHLRLTIEWT